MKRFIYPAVLLMASLLGCGGGRLADAQGAPATRKEVSLALGRPTSSGFTIDLPADAADLTCQFMGLWPFGTHGGGHVYDGGHPGWDLEYVAGAYVRSAADGIVQLVMTDSHDPSRHTVQIHHGGNYRTVYTNLENVVVIADLHVRKGDPLGTAGGQRGWRGSQQFTYYMTHFQLDDFSTTAPAGIANPNAISPEPYLSVQARAVFDNLWQMVGYNQELTEPLASNPRTTPNPFPIIRTWTLQGGPRGASFPTQIEFVYLDPASDPSPQHFHDYTFKDAQGNILETGTVQLNMFGSPFRTIDFVSSQGSTRFGIYDIIDKSMRINFGPMRPSGLFNAATYASL